MMATGIARQYPPIRSTGASVNDPRESDTNPNAMSARPHANAMTVRTFRDNTPLVDGIRQPAGVPDSPGSGITRYSPSWPVSSGNWLASRSAVMRRRAA